MFIDTDPEQAYWFQAEQIRTLETRYLARYLGYWCVKNRDGTWSDTPVDVFYQPDPERDQGIYFGFTLFENKPVLTDASSAFSEILTGVLLDSGEVLVSRFCHDLQCKAGQMIDGGRDYVKTYAGAKLVDITVEQGEFRFHQHHDLS